PGLAVLPDRPRPGDRHRSGDVAGTLRALLLVTGHLDQLARVLLRRVDVHELVAVAERREHLLAPGTDRVVARPGGERRHRAARDVRRRRAALRDPLLA